MATNSIILISEPDIRVAIAQFIFRFAQPQLLMDNIILGRLNNVTLPSDSNEFAVFNVSNTGRKMTNLKRFINATDYSEIALFQGRVQIDICSDNEDWARMRSNSLMNIGRSGTGVRFLKPYGISLLHADDGIPVDYVDGAGNIVNRFVNNINISYYSIITETNVDSFDKVKANIRNVDVSYPPKE